MSYHHESHPELDSVTAIIHLHAFFISIFIVVLYSLVDLGVSMFDFYSLSVTAFVFFDFFPFTTPWGG